VADKSNGRFWYYAKEDSAVGPLSLTDMTAILSSVASPTNVLVWRDGFPDWVRAGNVPEIAPRLVKPPPLPGSMPHLPPNAKATRISSNKLAGIGGWLVILAIGQSLAPLKTFAWLINYYTKLDGSLWSRFPVAFYGEALLNTLLFAIICYTSYLFINKSKLFVTYFVYQCAASILLFPLDVIFSSATLSAYTGQSIEDLSVRMIDPETVGQWIATIIGAAIWIPYIKLSRRVANTFI
jgi:hypothetical protein